MFFWIAQALSRRQPRTIDFDALITEVVSPEELIELYARERDNLESVEPIPGRLGADDFGRFVVRRKRPVYVPSLTDPAFSK